MGLNGRNIKVIFIDEATGINTEVKCINETIKNNINNKNNMKAKKMIAAIGVGAATMAMSLGGQAATVNNVNQTTVQHEVKATTIQKKVVNKHVKQNVSGSGLDLVTEFNFGSGLSPKQYGMMYGNGRSRIKKHNMNHVKHRHKVKSRMSN